MGRYGVKMFIVAVTTLLGVSMFTGTATDKTKKNKIIIIGIDGCRTDAVKRADAPVVHSFIRNGAYSYKCNN